MASVALDVPDPGFVARALGALLNRLCSLVVFVFVLLAVAFTFVFVLFV